MTRGKTRRSPEGGGVLAAKIAFKSPEQMITVIKDLRNKIEEYEEAIRERGGGVTWSQASTVLSNADYETRKHVMARGATQDLAKMQAVVEEPKTINLTAKPAKRMDVQMLAPMYQREDWDDADWTFWYEQGG